LKVDQPKTKEVAQARDKLVGVQTARVLIPNKGEQEEAFMRSMRNLPDAKILLANYLNIRDLLGYDKLVLPLSAIEVISSYLGK